jgi:hypothetical protein
MMKRGPKQKQIRKRFNAYRLLRKQQFVRGGK